MITKEQRAEINAALVKLADATSVRMHHSSEPRKHLGASVIGEDCAAKMWFGFRWAYHGTHSGQLLRLFETGHLYEDRFIKLLTAMGFELFPFAEDGNQWRITACEGHFGGSMDGGGIYRGCNIEALSEFIPEEQAIAIANALQIIRDKQIIVEFKTHNDKNFNLLVKNGVKLSHYKHHVQYSTYGTFYNLPYSLYLGYNKNTDAIHFELNANDAAICQDMVRKAEEIIGSQTRPNRIAENETYYECKFCSFKDICHNGAPMQKNCRSCRFASPGPNKTWRCSYWNGTIPEDVQPHGCDQWAQVG